MSKTGTYKVIDGKLVKISDAIPNLNGVFGTRFSEPYYSDALGQVVMSKSHKQYLMEKNNLVEYNKGDAKKKTLSTAKRQEEIANNINRYLTDRGVEGIKLKDLAKTKARRNESWQVNKVQTELREVMGSQAPDLTQA